MGCTPEGWLVLEGGVTSLVFMGGTRTTDCPTVGVCLVLEVTPLTTDATSARGCPPSVEDTGEPEVDLGFGTVVIGLEG